MNRAFFKQWLERFNQLQVREQWLVGAGAVFVVVVLLWAAIWQPIMGGRAARATQLADARAIATRLETVAAQVQSRRGGPAARSSESVLAVVSRTSRNALAGKAPKNIQDEGAHVRVWLEDATFNDLVTWIADLQRTYGIRVARADIEKKPTPGVVDARLQLERGA
jgi:general secretion pathway protein M